MNLTIVTEDQLIKYSRFREKVNQRAEEFAKWCEAKVTTYHWEIMPVTNVQKPVMVEEIEEETPRFPPVFRMAACRKCRFHCKPCLTLEEAKVVQDMRMEAHERSEAWKEQTVCQACRLKSNHRQNEIIAERNGHGKAKGKQGQIEALLKALQDCEETGYVLSREEMDTVYAKMRALGIEV